MHAHAHLAVLAVCALALVPCAAGTMCHAYGDFTGTAIADQGSGETCDSLSASMLTSLGGGSWSDATCESMASTTWSGALTVLASLGHYGANCCGSLAKTKCYDDSTMCDVDADYNGAAISHTKDDGSPGGTCDSVEGPMLTSLGETSWNDATCESMASTTWGSGATVLVSLSEFGANCCGSLAKTRCYDDSTMCDVDADFNGAAIAWTNDDGSAGGKCDSTAGGILARLGKTSWNALTCGSMASTISQKRPNQNVTALEEISWHGANCCGSLAKTRCFDEVLPPARANPVLGGRHVLY